MSWFDATGFANLAKTALKGAQKTIDKALDIKDEEQSSEAQTSVPSVDDSDNFFNAWGVDDSGGNGSKQEDRLRETSASDPASPLPKKLTSSTSLWGSFTGSFFDNPKNTTEGESISSTRDSPSRPTNLPTDRQIRSGFRSLSLDLAVHADSTHAQSPPSAQRPPPSSSASNDAPGTTTEDASSAATAATSDAVGQVQQKQREEKEGEGEEEEEESGDDGNSIREEIKNYPPVEVVFRERKPRNYTNRLSAISSESDRRSSESCEVIGSLTPDSERTTSISTSSSVARLRQSGSFGSVEVLTSPSSVEVLGSSSSNTTSVDDTNRERYSSDSISPVAENEGVEVIPELLEDDEETSLAEDSYTSASESTLNTTVLEYYHPTDNRRLDLINWDYTFEDISPRDGVLSRSSTSLTQMQSSMNQSCSSLGGIEQVPISLLGSELLTPSKLSEPPSDTFKSGTDTQNESGATDVTSGRNDCQSTTDDNSKDAQLVTTDCQLATSPSSSVCVVKSEESGTVSGDSEKVGELGSGAGVGDLVESGGAISDSQGGAIINTSSCEEGTLLGSSSEDVRMQESGTSTSSYLKNMLADAMSEKTKELSPHSSECRLDAKVGSSEHTSGDELETATSSDIEVISSPTPNGDSSSAASRQSPAKLHNEKTPKPRFGSWLTMAGRSSTESYDSFSAKHKGHQREHSGASSGGSDDNSEIEKLHKKISEMTEIIEARESKLFDLSRMNADLQEANSDLRSQLESQDVSQMSEEFMQRLAALERKFQQAIREKEVLRKQLEHAKAAAAASEREAESEKDQVIVELREEGEKLSKQQLSLNNCIKKLRATEKDNQKTINSLKEQLDEANLELERAKKSLSAKEEVERSQIEAVHQLTKSNQQLEKSATKLQAQVDSLTSTMASIQKELDESRGECESLKEEAAKAVQSAEAGVRKRLEEELEAASNQQEQLEGTIHDLRDKLSQSLEHNIQRESELRQENTELLRRLEAAELRSEELSDTVSSVTRPLLKQIEALTSSSSTATASWEKLERNHLQTINGLQSQLSLLEESERASREECARLSSINSNLEMKQALAQQEIDNMKMNISTLTSQIDSLKEENARSIKELEDAKSKLQAALDEARREGRALEQQLAVERAAVEAEKRRNNVLHEAVKARGASNPSPQTASPRSSPTLSFGRVSVSESMGSSAWPTFGDDAFDSASTSGRLGYDNIRPEYNTTFIESLQAHLKLRDGEVQQMQWELNKRDDERAALSDRVATLTAKTEEQEAQLAALSTQYDALLQMYGEKMEESQELRMDLQDVKDMYKAQIDQLLKKEPSVNS